MVSFFNFLFEFVDHGISDNGITHGIIQKTGKSLMKLCSQNLSVLLVVMLLNLSLQNINENSINAEND